MRSRSVFSLSSPLSFILLLAILLLAAFLRFHLLSAQSFWNDEGNSARIAERSLRLIVEGAAGDIHPPGYYLLLAGWRALAGDSEFALRSFSALAGVVVVALVYRLGLEYFDGPGALGAALFAALHPALIYYSQEARMYSLTAALGAATFLLMTRWLKSSRRWQGARDKEQGVRDKAQDSSLKSQVSTTPAFNPSNPSQGKLRITRYALRIPPSTRLALAYLLTATLALYTHYSFAFVLLAVNLAALGGMAFHRRELFRARAVRWLGLQAGVLILFAPWLPIAIRQLTTWPSAREYLPLWQAVTGAIIWLTYGPTFGVLTSATALLSALLLCLMGMRRGGQTITPLLWLAVPAGLTLALGLYSETFAKFLLTATPAACLFLGHGAADAVRSTIPGQRRGQPARTQPASLLWLSRVSAGLIALAVAGWMVFSLQHLYSDPAYARDDYRSIARQVEAQAQPGDAVILNAPNQWEVFTYYHREGAAVYPLPHERPPDVARTEAELAQIAAEHNRLFVLWWGEAQADPQQVVAGWLAGHAYPATDEWHGDVRLSLYGLATGPGNMVTTPAQFGEAITLDGYALPTANLAPGDILPLALFWHSTSATPLPAYKVFVHLTASDGFPLAQHDSEPAAGLRPTSTWAGGELVQDNHGLLLPPDLPPGDYRLVVGVYEPESGARLPVTSGGQNVGDNLLLTTVRVE